MRKLLRIATASDIIFWYDDGQVCPGNRGEAMQPCLTERKQGKS